MRKEFPAASCAALVPAAGLGTRLGLGPKALLKLGSLTLLEILLETLQQVADTIVVAAPPGHMDQFHDLAGSRAQVIAGGRERQESIERLVDACNESLLLIQDVARPFASARLCREVITLAARHGAAGAFLDPLVPVAHIQPDGFVSRYWPRRHAGIFQAPQAYRKDIFLDAMVKTANRHFQSPAEMVLEAGYKIARVEGEQTNIKITTAWDWNIARRVMAPLRKS